MTAQPPAATAPPILLYASLTPELKVVLAKLELQWLNPQISIVE